MANFVATQLPILLLRVTLADLIQLCHLSFLGLAKKRWFNSKLQSKIHRFVKNNKCSTEKHKKDNHLYRLMMKSRKKPERRATTRLCTKIVIL